MQSLNERKQMLRISYYLNVWYLNCIDDWR